MKSFLDDEASLDKELVIDDSSIFKLSEALKDHPRTLRRYYRLYAKAVKEVDMLNLELEIKSAEIMDTYLKAYAEKNGRSYPITGRSDLRKTILPLDKEYKALKFRLVEAVANMNDLKGIVDSWTARGFRLQELVRLAERTMFNSGRVTSIDDKLDESGRKLVCYD